MQFILGRYLMRETDQGYIASRYGFDKCTWLNGKKIKRGNQEQLEDGAVIRFAKKNMNF